MSAPFLEQALNNAWANATFYGALKGLDADAFAAARPGFFGSLKATMTHIYEVDHYYVDALEEGGLGRAVFDTTDIAMPEALGAAQAEVDMRLATFCRALTSDDLARQVTTDRRDGPIPERIDRLLLHLFQHQIHHRGQAHVQLQEAGIAPPQLDDFYLDYGRVPTAQAYWS